MVLTLEQHEEMTWDTSLVILKQLKEWKAQADRIPGAKVFVIPEEGDNRYALTGISESERGINLKYQQGKQCFELDIFRSEGDQLRHSREHENAMHFTSEGDRGEMFLYVPRSKTSSKGASPISISSCFDTDNEFEDDPEATSFGSAWSNTPSCSACGSVYGEDENYLHLPDGLDKGDIGDRLGRPNFTVAEHLSPELQLTLKPHLDAAPANTQAIVCCPQDGPDNWIALAFITLTEKREGDTVRVDIALPKIVTNTVVAKPGDIEACAAMLGWLTSETVLSHMCHEKEYCALSQLNIFIAGDLEGEQPHVQRSFVHGCHFFIPFTEWDEFYWDSLQDEIDGLPDSPPLTIISSPDYSQYVDWSFC